MINQKHRGQSPLKVKIRRHTRTFSILIWRINTPVNLTRGAEFKGTCNENFRFPNSHECIQEFVGPDNKWPSAAMKTDIGNRCPHTLEKLKYYQVNALLKNEVYINREFLGFRLLELILLIFWVNLCKSLFRRRIQNVSELILIYLTYFIF